MRRKHTQLKNVVPAFEGVQWVNCFIFRRRFTLAYAILILAGLSLLVSFNREIEGDVSVYKNAADEVFAGKLPYRDCSLEYPPYAAVVFLAPRIFGTGNYFDCFIMFGLLGDCAIKLILFFWSCRGSNPVRVLLPLFCYSISVLFIHYFYLQRYDIWPALISLIAACLFSSRRYFTSGLAISMGIGVKLYPILFVAPLLVLALRNGKGRQFAAGVLLGILPIVFLGFYLPWWQFAVFQSARGLQVESLWASLVWMGGLLGLNDAQWVYVNKWYEVGGRFAGESLSWARIFFIVGVVGSSLIAVWRAARLEKISLPCVARLALIPLLAFVDFNQVLSPQYMIWLLPLAAISTLEGRIWPCMAIFLATALTPIFYPAADYHSGLSIWETSVLILRNLILIAAWIAFCFSSKYWMGQNGDHARSGPERADGSPSAASAGPDSVKDSGS